MNHRYFNEISFQLNDSDVDIDYREGPSVMGRQALEGSTNPPPLEVRRSNPVYAGYEAMAEEIKAILLQVRQELRDTAAAATAPRQKVTCPCCGAVTIPDANGCCEFCGSPLNG